MSKRIIALILSALLLLSLVACGNVSGGSTSTKNEVPRMTPEETLDYINAIIETTNQENKYNPTDKLEVSYGNRFTNGHISYTFCYETDESGNVSEMYVDYFGGRKTYPSGMKSLDGFFSYVSLLICTFAIDDAETIWADAEAFFDSGARSGSIQASNGVTFEWSNFSTSKYSELLLDAKVILPSAEVEPETVAESVTDQTAGENAVTKPDSEMEQPVKKELEPIAGDALEVMEQIDDLCFSDWFEEGEDPKISDHYELVSEDCYICTPTNEVTISLYINEDGMVKSAIFDYNRRSSDDYIGLSYWQDYIMHFLEIAYGDDTAWDIASDLGIYDVSLLAQKRETTNVDGRTWTLFCNGEGHVLCSIST